MTSVAFFLVCFYSFHFGIAILSFCWFPLFQTAGWWFRDGSMRPTAALSLFR